MIDKIPFLGDIPRTFLMGDGYTMKLSGKELRIDHMGDHSNSKGNQRTCMVGLSYVTPVAFFTTRIDLPLFHSPTLALVRLVQKFLRRLCGLYVPLAGRPCRFNTFAHRPFLIPFTRSIMRPMAKKPRRQDDELFLMSVLDNIPDMIFVKDARTLRFVRFNKAGEKLLGTKKEDLIGKNDYDFFPKKEADFFIRKDRACF